MKAADIVLDASALVRGLQGESAAATQIVDGIAAGSIRAHAPDLIDPETANALLRLVRASLTDAQTATSMLEAAASLPLVRHPSAPHSAHALEVAFALRLSACDAFYAILSDLLGLPLVTADRRLYSAVPNATIVTDG